MNIHKPFFLGLISLGLLSACAPTERCDDQCFDRIQVVASSGITVGGIPTGVTSTVCDSGFEQINVALPASLAATGCTTDSWGPAAVLSVINSEGDSTQYTDVGQQAYEEVVEAITDDLLAQCTAALPQCSHTSAEEVCNQFIVNHARLEMLGQITNTVRSFDPPDTGESVHGFALAGECIRTPPGGGGGGGDESGGAAAADPYDESPVFGDVQSLVSFDGSAYIVQAELVDTLLVNYPQIGVEGVELTYLPTCNYGWWNWYYESIGVCFVVPALRIDNLAGTEWSEELANAVGLYDGDKITNIDGAVVKESDLDLSVAYNLVVSGSATLHLKRGSTWMNVSIHD